jgi:hypothetical protein
VTVRVLFTNTRRLSSMEADNPHQIAYYIDSHSLSSNYLVLRSIRVMLLKLIPSLIAAVGGVWERS